MPMLAKATTTAMEIIPHFVSRIFLFARLMLRIFLTHLSLVPGHGNESYLDNVIACCRYVHIHSGRHCPVDINDITHRHAADCGSDLRRAYYRNTLNLDRHGT